MREMRSSRRSLVKAAGCATSLPVLGAGVWGRTTEATTGETTPDQESSIQQNQDGSRVTAREEGFSNVIDITEAGADNTGEESINPVLKETLADDTLVKFPPGTYLLTDTVRFTGFSNFGLIGEDATIKIGPHRGFSTDIAFKFGVPYAPGNGLLIESLTFDQREPGRGVKAIQSTMNDGLRVRDILVRGEHDTAAESGGTFNIMDPDGRGVIDRFAFPDGVRPMRTDDGSRVVPGRSGITTNRNHVGTLWYRDCIIRSCHDNGLYVTGGGGTVVVQGGHYRNNNVSNIRIGGANSTIKDVKVVVDHNDVDHLNQRGIRLDAGANVMVNNADIQLNRPNGDAISVLNGIESATITDTQIFMGDRPSRGINVSSDTGPVRIVDTEITSTGADEGGNAIALQGGSSGNAASVIVENTKVTGNASGATGGREAILASRDNVTFREVTVEQPGTNLRQGINVGGDNCNIVNSTVRARHYPLVIRGENTLVQGSQLRSLGGYEAIRFYDGSDGRIFDNILQNGIDNSDTASVTTRGNEYL